MNRNRQSMTEYIVELEEDSSQIEQPQSSHDEECVVYLMRDDRKEDDMICKLCEKSHELVKVITPTVVGSTYRLSMNTPGLFRCSETEIQFQVTQPVTIEYEVDSWSNYTEILQNLRGGYQIIGPLFNIKSKLKPKTVSAVYLPHCLCIGGFTGDKSWIQCFHYKDDNLVLETPSRVEAMYAVMENPTFSLRGIFLYPLKFITEKIPKPIPYHGMVLLFYKTFTRDNLKYKYIFHLYLLPRIRTVEKEAERFQATNSFRRIPKPSQTESVYCKKKYRISGPVTARVCPKMLRFESYCPPEINPSYTEISINGDMDTEVDVSILPEDEDDPVWEAAVSAVEMLNLPSGMSKLTAQSGDHTAFQVQSVHFVDRHRADLIQMISLVDPILDDLLDQNLLTHEQYHTVLSETTSPQQMRKLYNYIRSWSNDDKDKVYKSLRRHNQPTIKNIADYHDFM